ncbi:MAG: glycosyltransferase family 4 protein [Candidatus Diapherotrites archaeon]|jgi:glycosyltransferase involved in cell wall biosynthesis|nr:glycosyltransferase family 4 protein [Candidatus Diapherotrites archaeon]MBT4596629.1 glycosyltransferase family 4 protein [Candidatus Diapherotrites archaeon]
MKVLRICPNTNMGLGKNITPFSKALAKQGVKQKILSEGIDFTSKAPFSIFRAGFHAVKETNLEEFDLVHIHNPSYWGALIKARNRAPTTVTFHGSLYYTIKSFWIGNIKQNIYYLFNGLICLFLANKVIFVNKKDQLFFSKIFRKKCVFLPTGIDKKIFNSKKKATKKYDLIFVGRDTPNKRVSEVRKIEKRFNLKTKYVLGDSKFSQKQLAQLYHESKFIVLPSFSEGLSKVILEAVACGCYPIISDCSKDSLTELNIPWIDFKQLNEKNLNAIKLIRNNLSNVLWDTIAKQTIGEYSSLQKTIFEPNQKVLIIEPHNDDALLSLGGTMLNSRAIDFTILSIVSNNNNGTTKFASLQDNVKSIQWKMKNIHNNESENKFYKINKVTKQQLENKIKKISKNFGVVLLPLGLYNPLHKLISKLDLKQSKQKVFFYRDIPYHLFSTGKQEYSAKKKQFEIKRIGVSNKIDQKVFFLSKFFGKDVKEFVENGPGKCVAHTKCELFFNCDKK